MYGHRWRHFGQLAVLFASAVLLCTAFFAMPPQNNFVCAEESPATAISSPAAVAAEAPPAYGEEHETNPPRDAEAPSFRKKYGKKLSLISIGILLVLVLFQLIIRKFESHRQARWMLYRTENLSAELQIEKSNTKILSEHIEYLTSNKELAGEEPTIFELKKTIGKFTKPYTAVFRSRKIKFTQKFSDTRHNRLIGIKNELINALSCILNDTLSSAAANSDTDDLEMSVSFEISEKPVNNTNTFYKFEVIRSFGLYDRSVTDIVQKYVKVLNGTIDVRHEDEKIISSITVPFIIAPDTATTAFSSEDEKVYDFSGLTALIADNNELNLAIMSELLKEVGFKTKCVRNGQQAVYAFNRAENNEIDIIIMDCDMPIMDAYTAAHTIRKSMHANHGTVPIIVMLSPSRLTHQIQVDDEKLHKSGINAGISNSMNTDEMYYIIEECLK